MCQNVRFRVNLNSAEIFCEFVPPVRKTAMAGQGRPRPAMAGQGRPRPAKAGQGRPWPAKAGHGRPRPAKAGHGRPRPAMASQGRPWPARAFFSALFRAILRYFALFRTILRYFPAQFRTIFINFAVFCTFFCHLASGMLKITPRNFPLNILGRFRVLPLLFSGKGFSPFLAAARVGATGHAWVAYHAKI